MQFICIYHPHDNVPPLSNRLPGGKKKTKRRSGGEIWGEDGAQWDGGEQKAPQTRATQARYCGTTGRGKGELRGQISVFLHVKLTPRLVFCTPVSGCNPGTPGLEAGILTRCCAGGAQPLGSVRALPWSGTQSGRGKGALPREQKIEKKANTAEKWRKWIRRAVWLWLSGLINPSQQKRSRMEQSINKVWGEF